MEVSKLAQCKDAAVKDQLDFGISCTRPLVNTSEVHATYETDVARLRREAKEGTTNRQALVSPTENTLVAQHTFVSPSSANSRQDRDVLVILNATILTMDPHAYVGPIKEAAVAVRNGVFLYVGATSGLPAYSGAKVIDAHGGMYVQPLCCVLNLNGNVFLLLGYVTPGFIDTHAHWIGFAVRMPATSNEMAVSLAYGVTTVHK